MVEGADVPRAVADQRQSLLSDTGKDQLAVLPIGQRLQRIGIDDLGIEIILTDVQAVLQLAIIGDTGAGDLGQAVNIVGT